MSSKNEDRVFLAPEKVVKLLVLFLSDDALDHELGRLKVLNVLLEHDHAADSEVAVQVGAHPLVRVQTILTLQTLRQVGVHAVVEGGFVLGLDVERRNEDRCQDQESPCIGVNWKDCGGQVVVHILESEIVLATLQQRRDHVLVD